MRATLFIVHPNDGLLRAISGLLVEEGYRVRAADTLDAVRDEVAAAPRPALLIVDDDASGPRWAERIEEVPADVPRLLLTWTPGAPMPPNVTALGKPFRARELLDAIARQLARRDPLAAPER